MTVCCSFVRIVDRLGMVMAFHCHVSMQNISTVTYGSARLMVMALTPWFASR